jgi:hypothetical protein
MALRLRLPWNQVANSTYPYADCVVDGTDYPGGSFIFEIYGK